MRVDPTIRWKPRTILVSTLGLLLTSAAAGAQPIASDPMRQAVSTEEDSTETVPTETVSTVPVPGEPIPEEPVPAEEDSTAAIPITPSATASAVSPLDAVLDSLQTKNRAASRWDRFVTRTDWDSTAGDWVPDPSVDLRGPGALSRVRFGPSPRLRFNKVEGMTPGIGTRFEWGKRPGLRISGGMDRATAPGRWSGEITVSLQSDARNPNGPPPVARTRLGGGGPEGRESPFTRRRGSTSWSAYVSYAERALVFGSNRPARAGLESALLSLDGRNYLDREERIAGIELRPSERLRLELAYVERRDRPLGVALSPLWNTDPSSWTNVPAEQLHTHGALLGAQAHLGFLHSVEITARLGAFGGRLGGEREFYPLGAEVRRAFHPPGSERLDVELWATTVLGTPPRQDLVDLGGLSSLRAHRPGEETGRASTLLRLDYVLGFDLFQRLNVPFARRLRLQPTVFVDVGAIWGDEDWVRSEDVGGPSSSDWRTDFGFGLQRNMGYPGLLDRVRVDFGWRTDRSSDRFRASVRFIP